MHTPGQAQDPHARALAELARLPGTWHGHGLLSQEATAALLRHAKQPTEHSLETGAGKSTVLLSNISADHLVFTLRNDSLEAALASPLLRKESVRVVEGPTQLTLPKFQFEDGIDLALLDGPHAYPFPDLEYYYVYPHLRTGALLVLDDIHIPTINNLFRFVREDSMFELIEVVETTAFLRRTAAPVFPTDQDGWWEQNYNFARFPLSAWPSWGAFRPRMRGAVPLRARRLAKRLLPGRLRQWLRT
jgi:predicted O-methyltransferase YrrM